MLYISYGPVAVVLAKLGKLTNLKTSPIVKPIGLGQVDKAVGGWWQIDLSMHSIMRGFRSISHVLG